MYRLAVLLLPPLVVVPRAIPQQKPKIKVKFSCTCTDMVGARYATAVRDVIAKSPRYVEADDFVEGTGNKTVWNYGIHVVSVDPSQNDVGAATSMAITLTWGTMYLTTHVQVCGTSHVDSCAASTLADLDEFLHSSS